MLLRWGDTGAAVASFSGDKVPALKEKASQRRSSTAPGNGTVPRKGTLRSSEVKFKALSQPPSGKEAALNACLPVLSAFYLLNTNAATTTFPGHQGTSEALSRPRHSGLTEPMQGAQAEQRAPSALSETFEHSSSTFALSSAS